MRVPTGDSQVAEKLIAVWSLHPFHQVGIREFGSDYRSGFERFVVIKDTLQLQRFPHERAFAVAIWHQWHIVSDSHYEKEV